MTHSSLGDPLNSTDIEKPVTQATVKAFKPMGQPLRWIIRPMLLLSLALHGLLVFFPMPPSEDDLSELDEVSIQVTTLPAPLNPPADLSPENPIPPDAPDEEPPPPTSAPAPPSPRVTPRPTTSAPPSETTPPPTTPPSTAQSPPPAPVEPPPPTHEPLPFSSFPHLANAEAGCYGLPNCRQIDGSNFRQAGTRLIDQLTAQGYDVRSRDDLEDSGLKVYEVTKDNTTRYLSLLQPDLSVAVYVLAAEPVTTAELQAAEPFEAQFESILREVANGQQARYTDFSYPDFFFEGAAPRNEIGNALYTVMETQPDRLAVPLTNQLTAEGFQVKPIGDYAGAPFYEVSQGAFVAYLSVVPTDDRMGTILVAWNSLPQ